MPFRNRIRLPFYLTQPQYPTERNVFRRADGTSKTISAVIRNTYIGKTDYLWEQWHRKLVIALSHDEVNIEGTNLNTGVVMDGDYEINWVDFLDYPVAPAAFTIQVTPFDATNSNCQTCSQVSQLNLVDDLIPGDPLVDGGLIEYNVFDNDSICCYPPTAELTYINLTFLENVATISAEGVFSAEVVTPVGVVDNQLIATYRVTCPDGSYDEANIYANFAGSGPEVCCAPADLAIDDGHTEISWTASCVPPDGFVWDIRLASNPGVPIESGTTTDTFITIPPGVIIVPDDYIFTVYSDCGGGNVSGTVTFDFTIGAAAGECKEFEAGYFPGFGGALISGFSYMNCQGEIINIAVGRNTSQIVCALVNEGTTTPVYWAASQPHSSFTATGNNCGGGLQTTARLSATEGGICGETPVSVWLVGGSVVAPGVTVYLDAALTMLAPTGFIDDTGGNIYSILTGVVDVATGNAC